MKDLEILYRIKDDVVFANDEHTLINLEINLKHYINIKKSIEENFEEYDIEDVKNTKNAISIAIAYHNIIKWKKFNIQLDKRIATINSLINLKSEVFDIFEKTKQISLSSQYDYENLIEENKDLKQQLSQLKREKEVSNLPIGVHPNKMHRLKEVKDLKKIRRKIEQLSEELFSYLDDKIEKNEI